ncbi:MAG: hypothetical protein QXK74_06200 [Candidatus Nitrosocaldaceae archaeon]
MILFKKEKSDEYKEVDLDELLEIINSKLSEEINNILTALRPLRDNIVSVITSIKSIGNDIDKFNISKDEFAIQYINAMKNTKRNILAVIDSLDEPPLIKDVNEIDDIKKYLTSVLTRIGDVASSHRRVMYELFSTHSKRLKTELEKLQAYSKEANILIDRYNLKITILNNIKTKIRLIYDSEDKLRTIKDEMKNYEINMNNARARYEEMSNKLKEFDKSDYLKYNKEYEDIKREYDRMINEFNQLLSSITRVINKYDYTIGIDKRTKNIILKLYKPYSINEDEAESLISLFKDIIRVIRDNKLRNVEKEERVLSSLIEGLHLYIDRAKRYEFAIEENRNKIRPLEMKVKELENAINVVKSEIKSIEDKIRELTIKEKEMNILIEDSITTIEKELTKVIPSLKIKR